MSFNGAHSIGGIGFAGFWRIMNLRANVSLFLLLVCLAALIPLGAENEKALVSGLTGAARVTREGKTEDLRIGSVLLDSDRIQTGKQSQLTILYKGIMIRLLGETDATLVSLTNSNKPGEVRIQKGFGWFRIDDPTKRGFRALTPVSIAAVRGTKFAVSYDGATSTSCVCEGRVATSNPQTPAAVSEMTAGGSNDYSSAGATASHDFKKYFKKLKVDQSFQKEIARDAKLAGCKTCHRMTNIATDRTEDPKTY